VQVTLSVIKFLGFEQVCSQLGSRAVHDISEPFAHTQSRELCALSVYRS
jgi:hypothetical protein